MFSKFNQLGKESIVYGFGGVASRFISFFLLPVYTRVFNPSEYGIIDVIATVTMLATILLTAGIDTALSYYFYQKPSTEDRKKTINAAAFYSFAINSLLAVVVWIFAPEICQLLFKTSTYAIYMRIAILAIPFSSLVTLNLNVLRLQRKPWAYLSLSLPQVLLSVLLNIYLVVILDVGILGVFTTNVVVSLLTLLAGLFINRQYFSLRHIDLPRLRLVIRYGLPLVIAGISMWSISYLGRYFLLHYESLDQIGIYSVGLKIAAVVAIVTQAFRLANAPFQFEMSSSDEAPEVYGRTLTYFILGTSFICVPVALYARPVLQLLTTEAYFEAYRVVPFASYALIVYGVSQLVGVGLLITKRTGVTGILTAVGALANVVYLFVLVPMFGIIGAALATLLAQSTIVILKFIFAQRAYWIPYDLRRVTIILLTAWCFIALGFVLESGNFWMDVVVATIVFAACILIMTSRLVLFKEERQVLINGLKLVAQRVWHRSEL